MLDPDHRYRTDTGGSVYKKVGTGIAHIFVKNLFSVWYRYLLNHLKRSHILSIISFVLAGGTVPICCPGTYTTG